MAWLRPLFSQSVVLWQCMVLSKSGNKAPEEQQRGRKQGKKESIKGMSVYWFWLNMLEKKKDNINYSPIIYHGQK